MFSLFSQITTPNHNPNLPNPKTPSHPKSEIAQSHHTTKHLELPTHRATTTAKRNHQETGKKKIELGRRGRKENHQQVKEKKRKEVQFAE